MFKPPTEVAEQIHKVILDPARMGPYHDAPDARSQNIPRGCQDDAFCALYVAVDKINNRQ
jgi:hypothetical protein